MMLLRVHLHSFACGYLVSPVSYVEKVIIFPLNYLGLLVYRKVYFQALSSIPLVFMSVFMSVSHCFDSCSFVMFEIRICDSSNFVLLSQDFVAILDPLKYYINFRKSFSISANVSLGL